MPQTEVFSRNAPVVGLPNMAYAKRPRPVAVLAFIIMCCGLTLMATGCPWAVRPPAAVTPGELPAPALQAHEEAVRRYMQGDHEGAAKRFAVLREQTGNPVMARMALYGEACARLMAAETVSDYSRALALWEAWLDTDPAATGHEDARLFAPLVREKMIFSHMPPDLDAPAGNGQQNPGAPKWYMVEANQALRQMTLRLDATEQQVKNKEHQIKVLENEIDRLNQQIEAFEKIDQRIQERKSAIPSTD